MHQGCRTGGGVTSGRSGMCVVPPAAVHRPGWFGRAAALASRWLPATGRRDIVKGNNGCAAAVYGVRVDVEGLLTNG